MGGVGVSVKMTLSVTKPVCERPLTVVVLSRISWSPPKAVPPGQKKFGAYFRLSDFQSANFAQTFACAGTPTLYLAGQLAGYNLTSTWTDGAPGPTAPGNGGTAPENGGTAPENGAKHVYPTFEPAYEYFILECIYLCVGKASSLPTVISQCGEVDKS